MKRNEEYENQLAEVIHRELAKLPERSAPATLIPAVLAEIERRKRQWWRRPWFEWPTGARLLSLPAMLGCCGLLVGGLFMASRSGVPGLLLARAEELARPLAPAWSLASALGNAALATLRSLPQSWWLLAAATVFFMYLACVGLGTACFHVVARKR